jgi:hypothetical protein
MKFLEFVSELIKSFWAWVGFIMDIISGIVYVNPNLVEKFSFLNVFHKYLLVWIVLGTFLIVLSAWRITNKILEKRKKTKTSEPSTTEEYHVESGGVGKQKAEIINNFFGDSKKKR